MKKNRFILILFSFLIVFVTKAQIELPAILGDNMLLQQDTEVSFWGWSGADKVVTVKPSWSEKVYTARADKSGKWSLKITTPKAGYDTYTISVSEGKNVVKLSNVLIGEVWLCSGQSNMEMPMRGFRNQPIEGGNESIARSKNKNIRLINVKRNASLNPEVNFIGGWSEASSESVSTFSAAAYYYGKMLNEILDVPVGLVVSAWGGSIVESWMSESMLKGFDDVVIPAKGDSLKVPNHMATPLFNGMINPIVGYTIKGAIWYQGESNYKAANKYQALFEAMVIGWRQVWEQGDFPFYYCQIAPYNHDRENPNKPKSSYNSAFLREAQYNAAQVIPNSGMAVLMDVGEEFCIHPRDKKTAGNRLALLALTKTYQMKGFSGESPILKEMKIDGGKAILSFDNAPMALTAFGKELSKFEIAGTDKVFYPAKAQIKREVIEVSSDKVPAPVAVRYAFEDFVVGDLFSNDGLPVSSFRTDDWDQ